MEKLGKIFITAILILTFLLNVTACTNTDDDNSETTAVTVATDITTVPTEATTTVSFRTTTHIETYEPRDDIFDWQYTGTRTKDTEEVW